MYSVSQTPSAPGEDAVRSHYRTRRLTGSTLASLSSSPISPPATDVSKVLRIPMMYNSVGADFLGAMGTNVRRENSSVGALHPEEFGSKIPSTAVSSQLRKYNYCIHTTQRCISANSPVIQNMATFVQKPSASVQGTLSRVQ